MRSSAAASRLRSASRTSGLRQTSGGSMTSSRTRDVTHRSIHLMVRYPQWYRRARQRYGIVVVMSISTEFEAKILDVDPDLVVGRIKRVGGVHVADRLMRRYVYD